VRKLQLSKAGFNKVKSKLKELKSSDIDDSIKSLPPGEWCHLSSPISDEGWIAFINPNIDDKYSCAHVLIQIDEKNRASFDPGEYIEQCLVKAYGKRKLFKGYETGSRIFYGLTDGLPGLIVDHFQNASVIQINTAGIDRYRDRIQAVIARLTGVSAYFLDNPKYREKELLPTYPSSPIPDLIVSENGLEYHLSSEVIQKVGFYYDHRENRLQLQYLLDRLNLKPKKGLDLFCYAGAWGLNALKAGVDSVTFVDQGNFKDVVFTALKNNKFENRGEFIRGDVFKFLEDAYTQKKKFDLLLCDPPAFAKSPLQKPQALEGYSRLHRRVIRLAEAGSVCAFSSCTHYVTHQEFQKNIIDAAAKEGRKAQLVYSGIQGWDHPVSSLEDKANYIKSYFYILE
jgi:23S rRNA (cytosine1962-C5)-methyltransferase